MQLLFFTTYLSLILFITSKKNERFPNRSTQPLFPPESLRIVGELPERPGNLDVDPVTGRVFFTFHPMGNPSQVCKVCELREEFQGFDPFGPQDLFVSVLSIRVMKKERKLLALDHRNLGETSPRLHVLDLETQTVTKTYIFPSSIAGKGSMLNDFVISKDENYLFIADIGIGNDLPSIITVNLKTWSSTKALVQHESTKARNTPDDFRINGTAYNLPFKVGVDSITLSRDGTHLYFGAIFDPYMWVVSTKSLIIGKDEPDFSVDVAFPKPISDGIALDEDTGVLYLTDFEHSAIWITDPNIPGRHKTLVKNENLLRWPDGLSIARGYLWITASAIHELLTDPPESHPPYHILRIPLIKPIDERTEL